MRRLRRLLGVAVIVVAAGSALGCAGSRPPAAGTGALGDNPGAAASAADTGPATPASTPPPVTYPGTAAAYAKAAVAAWEARDAVRLGQLNDAGDTVFATLDGGDYNRVFHLYQCTGAAGSSICAFYNEVGDELDLRVLNSLVGQARAVRDGQWHPITFPADYRAYAQEAISDWTSHNTAAVALLTGKSGDSAFAAVPAARRSDVWTFDHEEGGTGHLFYIFTDPAGDSIIVSFPNYGVAPTPANRHGLIEVIYYETHS